MPTEEEVLQKRQSGKYSHLPMPWCICTISLKEAAAIQKNPSGSLG